MNFGIEIMIANQIISMARNCVLFALTAIIFPNIGICDTRVALVIANSNYRNTPPLRNPANDGSDVAGALRAIGFDVIFAADADKHDMDRAIVQFSRKAAGADAALFYYAGHGLQFQGHNYLVPVDAELVDQIGLRYEATDIDDIKTALAGSAAVKMLILDACRNDPLAERLNRSIGSSRGVGATRGLAQMEKANGMLVVYATQANEVAQDGTGRNSPFSKAFLDQIREPGLETSVLFRRISKEVYNSTQGHQEPEISISNFPDYFLNQADTDQSVWIRARDTADEATIRNFITQYPDSIYLAEAKLRLELIQRGAMERAQADEIARQNQKLRDEFARSERERGERNQAAALEKTREETLASKLAEANAQRQQILADIHKRALMDQETAEKQRDAELLQSRADAEHAHLDEAQRKAELQAASDRELALKAEVARLQVAAADAKNLQQALVTRKAEASKLAEADVHEKDLAQKLESAESNRKNVEAELLQREAERDVLARADNERQIKIDAALDAVRQAQHDKDARDVELRQAAARERQLEAEIEALRHAAPPTPQQVLARGDDRLASPVPQAPAAAVEPPTVQAMKPMGLEPNVRMTSVLIKTELQRLSCFSGGDTEWTPSAMRQAFATLAKYAPSMAASEEPTLGTLNLLKALPNRICVPVCGAGTVLRNGVCIVKTVARALPKIVPRALPKIVRVLKPTRLVVVERPPATQIVPRKPVYVSRPIANASPPPSSGKACFSFKGKQFCE